MNDMLAQVALNAFEANPPAPADYIDEEGLRRCAVCGERKEKYLEGFDKPFPCICRCEQEKRDAEKAKARRTELFKAAISRPVYLKVHNRHIAGCTFENHDGTQPKILQAAKRYVENWPQIRENGHGLYIWGGCGTGKSFLAGCIVNALQAQEIPVLMASTTRLLTYITSADDSVGEVDSLNHYELLVLDDFGAERQTPYMLEQLTSIVDERINSGLPLLITSNVKPAQLRNPTDGTARLYDRIKECVPLELMGRSRREERASQSRSAMRDLLGLA